MRKAHGQKNDERGYPLFDWARATRNIRRAAE
jgi:hypothetical protein